MWQVFPRNWIFSHYWLIIFILCTNSHETQQKTSVQFSTTNNVFTKIGSTIYYHFLHKITIDWLSKGNHLDILFHCRYTLFFLFMHISLRHDVAGGFWFYKYGFFFSCVKRSNERLFRRGHKILPIMCHKCELCIINFNSNS